MKRKKALSLIAALLVGISSTTATSVFAAETNDVLSSAPENIEFADNGENTVEPAWIFYHKYVCTGNDVRVRTQPNTTTSTVVGYLYKGDTVMVKSIDNGWAKINWNGQTRYVSSTYLKEA